MNKTSAFTLIELIMTIIVVSIVGIPLGLMVSQYITSSYVNEDLTSTMQLVRLELEKLQAAAFDDINTAFFSQYEGFDYDLDRTVTYEQGNPSTAESLKKIQIRVYRHNKPEVLSEFVTFRARNVSL